MPWLCPDIEAHIKKNGLTDFYDCVFGRTYKFSEAQQYRNDQGVLLVPVTDTISGVYFGCIKIRNPLYEGGETCGTDN